MFSQLGYDSLFLTAPQTQNTLKHTRTRHSITNKCPPRPIYTRINRRERGREDMAYITTPPTKPSVFSPLCQLKKFQNNILVLNSGHTDLKLKQKRIHTSFVSNYVDKANRRKLLAIVNAVSVEATEPEPIPEVKSGGRILLSDVVVKKKRRVYFGRKWTTLDICTATIVLAIHLLSVFAPFYFTWSAFWVAFGLYVVTGLLGITLSYHRNLSHRSFKLPKWLEYMCAYCGVQALQGNPISWVSTHRYHHQFCDSERDPHSPVEGFWFSHMSWLFDNNGFFERCGGPSNVGDLEKQPFYKFLENTYILHPIALGVLLYALGGVPFLVWGMGVRIVWVFHITWLVNSACHVWGKQAWNTGDLSRNNWWVALLAFGEGWHNNHHAFEFSARHGLEWWQLDMTWYVVRFLQAIGLATDVKLPTQLQKQRMSITN